jgi:hypothetical protein
MQWCAQRFVLLKLTIQSDSCLHFCSCKPALLLWRWIFVYLCELYSLVVPFVVYSNLLAVVSSCNLTPLDVWETGWCNDNPLRLIFQGITVNLGWDTGYRDWCSLLPGFLCRSRQMPTDYVCWLRPFSSTSVVIIHESSYHQPTQSDLHNTAR